MSDVYFIIVPVVVVVVILNLCLIFWRVWLYQKRREQQMLYFRQQQQIARSTPSARVVRVERCVGPGGYAQRTSYAINQPGMPTRQLTRTVVIRPARDNREDDPNMPPTYDQAVTGKDQSVLVEGGAKDGQQQPQGGATVPPRAPQGVPPSGAPPPSAPGPMPRFAPPPFSTVPRAQNTGASNASNQPAPPGYSPNAPPPPSAPAISRDRSDSYDDADDRTALLM